MTASSSSSSTQGTINKVAFIALHFVPLLAFFTHVTRFDWIVCVVLYVSRMFFVTAGYHRYFSHRTYKTSRWFQAFLAFCSQTSGQKGVLWWAAHHRVHHRHSDTALDPHSKKVHGFWESHVGWIMGDDHEATDMTLVKDLAKYPELLWLDKYHWIPPVLLGVAVTVLGQLVNGGNLHSLSQGWSTLFIGFFLSTVVLYHATFAINSVMHWIGRPRYETGDESRNSFTLAILSLGEGWHNNHHYYQSSTRQGFFWWEVDISYYIIRLLGAVGLVWEIREVPDHIKYPSKERLANAA
jgi:stearoyl-CoA desaturase (delta-9 desaturase)